MIHTGAVLTVAFSALSIGIWLLFGAKWWLTTGITLNTGYVILEATQHQFAWPNLTLDAVFITAAITLLVSRRREHDQATQEPATREGRSE